MDNLVLEYRDPLFGIMVIVSLVFIFSFLTYSWGIYKEKKSRQEYRKLLKRFELGKLKEEDYVHLYATYNLPFDSILLLASTFLHKGDYTKAISVYLTLLEHVQDRVKKEELLDLLGTTYFKGGFLQRSKDIFLKILKFSPRNQHALEYLLIIYEKLKEYDKAEEVIDSLSELKTDIFREKIYISTLRIISDPLMSFEEKSTNLLAIFKMNKIVERLVVQFLIQFNKTLFWQNLELFNVVKFLDLMWYLDFNDIDFGKVSQNKLLRELYSAKGYINEATQSEKFELNILITLHKEKSSIQADLNFEFLCSKCKKVHPVYEPRCPHCHGILTFKVEPQLARSFSEKNLSLQ